MSVYRIAMVVYDEDAPGHTLATKSARVHDSDVDAGKYLFEIKQKEMWADLLHIIESRAR